VVRDCPGAGLVADVLLDATSEEFRWISAGEASQYDPYVQEIIGAAVQSP
jgi:hypothetical protein